MQDVVYMILIALAFVIGFAWGKIDERAIYQKQERERVRRGLDKTLPVDTPIYNNFEADCL